MVTIKQIDDYLSHLNIEYSINASTIKNITRFCEITKLKSNSITWIKNINKYDLSILNNKELNIIIVSNYTEKYVGENYNFIFCNNPREVFFKILGKFFQPVKKAEIAETAIIKSNKIGCDVNIGHNSYIGKDVTIEDYVSIGNNVVINDFTIIGRNTNIHDGVIIGADSFGYYQDESKKYHKVPHFGNVVIGKDVEIGANTCIDRGTISETVIGDNTKIGNLCQIAHNVVIGFNVLIASRSSIAGSCSIGDNVYIAPGVVIKNQIKVDKDAFVGIGSVVISNIKEDTAVAGNPAKEIKRVKQSLQLIP